MNTVYRSGIALLLSLTPLASVLVIENSSSIARPVPGELVKIANVDLLPPVEADTVSLVSGTSSTVIIRRGVSSHSGKEQVEWGVGKDVLATRTADERTSPPPPPPPPPATSPVSSS